MNTLIKKTLLLSTFLMVLASCGSGPSGTRVKPNSKAKVTGMDFYQQQDYFSAVDWLNQAWQKDSNDSEVYVALLDSWKQLDEITQIWKLMNQSSIQTDEVIIIQAELSGEEKQCELALNNTNDIDTDSLSNKWQKRFWQFRASCEQQTKAYLPAVKSLVQLSELSDDELMTQVWSNQIVNNLIRANEDELILAIGDDSYDLTTQGWLEAAYIDFGADGISGSGWSEQWPQHPATQYFLDMNQVNRQQTVAVLLPLSGRFESAAKAVQKGLLTASVADENNQYDLQFYDTGSQAENFSGSWYAAQEQGADLIIGPLDKASIEAAEMMPAPTVPVVMLNQSNSEYFQFTLSPEGEAEQVAHRMYDDGQRRTIILAPNDEWGERMAQAFAQKFVDLGGTIIDNTYFQKDQHDFSAQLRKTLGLVESQLRAKNLQSFLKINLQADEVVRSDIDAIFLAARPGLARLMVPQLKFHRASDVPVYSSSHVFNGLNNEQHNRDLQGVKFAISPIELPSSQLMEILPFELSRVNDSKKLFALGYDAYQLISRLEWMSRVNTGVIDGLTGKISLNYDGQFNRGLRWAQYNNGSIDALH